jgi:hypothetical protein
MCWVLEIRVGIRFTWWVGCIIINPLDRRPGTFWRSPWQWNLSIIFWRSTRSTICLVGPSGICRSSFGGRQFIVQFCLVPFFEPQTHSRICQAEKHTF